jgi:exodeoxyribonuclease VII small subunit
LIDLAIFAWGSVSWSLHQGSGGCSTAPKPTMRSPVTDQPERPSGEEAPIDGLSFDDALTALQKTVAELEAGGQPLERSIALYERGVALHERCAKLLGEAELKVQQLVTRAGGALEAIDVSPDAARDTE